MTQASWPGLRSTTFDPAPHPFDIDTGAAAARTAGGAGYGPDAIASPWWAQPPAAPSGGAFGTLGANGAFAFVQSIVAMIGQLVSSLFAANAPARQRVFADADFSSTGDPHLAETGTYADGTRASAHFDSMVAHEDLLDAGSVAGGYRVSTTVTPANAHGITWNASATVHANDDRDAVTMNADGSVAIRDAGEAVTLAKGQTLTLSGGETVTENADGSLVVGASDGFGGSMSTTVRTNGTGVDISTHAHGIAVGGDIVTGTAAPRGAHQRRSVRVREVA